MIIDETETKLICEIREDLNGLGFYAVSRESPKFVLHSMNLQSLGIRLREMKKQIDRLEKTKNGDVISY
jgi:hypothetical protein